MAIKAVYSTVPTCGTGCSTALLAIQQDVCNVDLEASEIVGIAISHEPFNLNNASALVEWDARTDNSATDPDKPIRIINVIGDKTAPEKQNITIYSGIEVPLEGTHTINVNIPVQSQPIYEFLNGLNCGKSLYIGYFTSKNYYGGDDGIRATANLGSVMGRGNTAFHEFQGTFQWRVDKGFEPPRTQNPITFPYQS